MTWRTLLLPGLSLLVCSGMAVAQQVQDPSTQSTPSVNTDQVRRGTLHRRQMRIRRRLAVGRMLNLTDDQKKQRQEIRQKYLASTRTEREQLFRLREKRSSGTFTAEDREMAKALRQEMRNSMVAMRTEALNALTAEQRSKVETFRQERKQRREEILKRRLELLKNKPSN